MAKKIKYTIHPGKEIIALKPILPSTEEKADFSFNSLSFFDLNTNQFLSDWIEPSSLLAQSEALTSNGQVTAIMGNLLNSIPSHLKSAEITHIDNIPIQFLEEVPNSKIAHIHKSQSTGELTVYCLANEHHQPGDFIYTLGTQEINQKSEPQSNEIFSYTLSFPNHKQITLQLSIQLSEEDLDVELPDLAIIQEQDLMINSLAKTRGLLPIHATSTHSIQQVYAFLPIEQQYSLKSLHLTSQNQPLVYELHNQGSQLHAKQAQTHKTVFTAALEAKGLYDFELHHPIDKPKPVNLLSSNFKRTKSSLYQDISTKAGKIYNLSFYFKPFSTVLALPTSPTLSVELWWAGILIAVIPLLQETLKGYHFSLEGSQDHARIEFKLSENLQDTQALAINAQDIANHLDNASIASEEQPQIRFELGFSNLAGSTDQFPIIINLENELLVSPNTPYTITMDDLSPYKKIVLTEHHILSDLENMPLTVLNIEKIFDQMQIPESHRQVDVEQLAQSNIYEIKISDSSDKHLAPITVADVELSFDGGDAGVEMLFRYLSIDV